MNLKLKEGWFFECDQKDWMMVGVYSPGSILSGRDGRVVVEARIGEWIRAHELGDDGYSVGFRELELDPLKAETWDKAAHGYLVSKGWFTPWEEIPS